jgi:hypothetical protein
MCEPRRLTTLWAFTPCYRDSFIFYFYHDVFLLALLFHPEEGGSTLIRNVGVLISDYHTGSYIPEHNKLHSNYCEYLRFIYFKLESRIVPG